MNDGTKPFPANPTANTNSFGGCLRDYKNTHTPVVVRVSYIGGVLKVSADTHSKGKKMMPCFEQKDLNLPVGYHFGFSVSRSSLVPVHSSLFCFGLVVFRLFACLFVLFVCLCMQGQLSLSLSARVPLPPSHKNFSQRGLDTASTASTPSSTHPFHSPEH